MRRPAHTRLLALLLSLIVLLAGLVLLPGGLAHPLAARADTTATCARNYWSLQWYTNYTRSPAVAASCERSYEQQGTESQQPVAYDLYFDLSNGAPKNNPGVPQDDSWGFTATRQEEFNAGNLYTFIAAAYKTMVYIDNSLVFDDTSACAGCLTANAFSYQPPKTGWHTIRIEYSHFYSDALFRLWWTSVPHPIPAQQTYGCGCQPGDGARPTNTAADPVSTATGAFITHTTDMSLPGHGLHFSMDRAYTSTDTTTGPLGQGWTHPYNSSLTIASPTGDATFRSGDGQQLHYTHQADGSFTGDPGATATLTATANGYNLTTPDSETLTFTSSGQLVSDTDRNSNSIMFAYTSGQLTSLTDSANRTVAFSYTGTHLTRVTLPDGRHEDYAYTGDLLTSATDPAGNTTTYGYDTSNRLATVTDPLGHTLVSNAYDGYGRVTSQMNALGQRTTFGWNGSQTTTTDPRGNTWTDTYSGNVLIAQTDPLGNRTQYVYDNQLNLVQAIRADGTEVGYSYDDHHNRIGTFGDNWSTAATYDSSNNLITSIDGLNNTTTYTYDSHGNLLTSTSAGSARITNVYTATGLLASTTDPRGDTTTFDYDSFGNRTAVHSPSGRTFTYVYDAAGRVTGYTSARGNAAGANPAAFTTTYTYNQDNQLLTTTDPLGQQTSTTYDAVGRQLTSTDANGHTTTYGYDAAGHLTDITDPVGRHSTLEYDAAGNPTATVDPAGNRTTYTYDADGRRASITQPRGNIAGANASAYTTTYSHDQVGNVSKVVQPAVDGTAGPTMTYTYDDRGHTTSVTDPTGAITSYTYDADGHLAGETDALGHTTSYAYNADGQRTGVTDPTGNTTTSGYDASGALTSTTSALGNITTRTYTTDGQLAATVNPRGNETGANPATYTTSYSYDTDGNQTAVIDANGHTSRAAYDATNQVTSRTDANGHVTTYAYDRAGHLTSVTGPDNAVTSYAYDPAGQLTTRTDANGHVTTYAYNPAGALSSLTTPGGGQWTYGYDANGDRTTATDPAGIVTAAAYDNRDELTSLSYSDGTTPSQSYTYDAAGRVATQATTGPSTALLSVSATGGAVNNWSGVWPGNMEWANQAISKDGRYVTFISTATNLTTPPVASGSQNVYVHDLTTGTNQLASVTSSGAVANAWSSGPNISADGTQVAFSSTATNLAPGTTSSRNQIYVRNLTSGKTVLISAAADGTPGNQTSDQYQTISATGRFIAFTSQATNLVPGDSNSSKDVFVADRDVSNSGTFDTPGNTKIVRVDVSTGGGQTSDGMASQALKISADGRYVVFQSWTSSLVAGTKSNQAQVYLHDRDADGNGIFDEPGAGRTSTTLVSVASDDVTPGDNHSQNGDLSADGKYVTFVSLARNLVPNDSGSGYHVYVRNLTTGTTIKLTDGDHRWSTISPNDRYIAYGENPTTAPNGLQRQRTWIHDRDVNGDGTLDTPGNTADYLVSPQRADNWPHDSRTAPGGFDGAGDLVFVSNDPLVSTDTNNTTDVYLHRAQTTVTDTLSYDSVGDLTSYQRGSDTYTYGYDAAGRIGKRVYPDGTAYSYTYNGDGELATDVDAAGTTNFSYDPAGALTASAYPNGVTETRSYDPAGQLNDIGSARSGITLTDNAYTRDAVGNPTTVASRTGGTSETQTYTHDPAGRVTSACYQASGCASTPDLAWTYDGVGNRLTETRSTGTTSYSYNSNDQLTTAIGPSGTIAYGYDASGRQISAGTSSYTYDAASRLTSTYVGTHYTSYGYGPDGTRTTATDVDGTSTGYSWDPNSSLPLLALERNANGATVRSYGYGTGVIPDSVISGGQTYRYARDAVGSTVGLTDASGIQQIAASYEPFGATRSSQSLTGSAPANVIGFAGQLQDPSGLYDMRAREYDPTQGRFTATDPLTPDLGDPYVVAYVYVANQPGMLVDPSGATAWSLNPFADVGHAASGAWAKFQIDVGSKLPMIPDPAVNGLAGAANGMSGGVFDFLLNAFGLGKGVNKCSAWYKAGYVVGAAISTVADPGAGDAEVLGEGVALLADTSAVDRSGLIGAVEARSGETARAGWSVGDDVYATTRAGNEPSWSTVRSRFWKNEAADPKISSEWSDMNLKRMQRGLAPKRYNADKGGMESMELSHEPIPYRDGGREFVPRWPCDHAAIDPYRKTGYC